MRSQTAILYRSTHMQSHAHDELLKIYRREYKRRFAWSKEAQKKNVRTARSRRWNLQSGWSSNGGFYKNDYELSTKIEILYHLICIRISYILRDFIAFLLQIPRGGFRICVGCGKKYPPGELPLERSVWYNTTISSYANPISSKYKRAAFLGEESAARLCEANDPEE